jgi:formylglycine-generating enzyme required for sulfatase activity
MKFLLVVLIGFPMMVFAQNVTIRGKVVTAETGLPLVSATIILKAHPFGTTSGTNGEFTLALPEKINDTLFISYVGFKTFATHLNNIDTSGGVYSLKESAIVLDEIVILSKKSLQFEPKRIDGSMKVIRGTLYAGKTEVTNLEYNVFLSHLLNNNQTSLFNEYKPDISRFNGSELLFFKAYHSQQTDANRAIETFDDYPILNISHEAAVAYCKWLTESYNSAKGKKKYKKVIFRLPELKEWQIAALGYPGFQSWVVEENNVEVFVPDNPVDEVGKTKKVIPVKGNEILYPWYGAYNYRNKPQNKRSCWMGNFKVPEQSLSCVKLRAGGDGYVFSGNVATYFPNGMGLYDVVGNVSEMLKDEGKACGGSWNHSPEESTIMSVNSYSATSGAVGFRLFMEVVEK